MSEEQDKSVSELIQEQRSLIRVRNAIAQRIANVRSEEEKREINALMKRSISPQCSFDRKHTKLLLDLAIDPPRVNLYWKLRERWHRFIHHH